MDPVPPLPFELVLPEDLGKQELTPDLAPQAQAYLEEVPLSTQPEAEKMAAGVAAVNPALEAASLLGARIPVGRKDYYNIHELALLFRVPVYHFQRAVHLGELHGAKVGKALIISAEEFHRYIISGNFSYKPRNSRKRDLEQDLDVSRRVLGLDGTQHGS